MIARSMASTLSMRVVIALDWFEPDVAYTFRSATTGTCRKEGGECCASEGAHEWRCLSLESFQAGFNGKPERVLLEGDRNAEVDF